jgi:hypothetical protein
MALVVATRGDPQDRIDGCNAARPANLGPLSAVAKRQNIGGTRPAPPETEEWNMRAMMIAAVVAAGVGLGVAAPSFAAPVSGPAIGKAAATNHVVKRVHWRHWRHHYRHHRYYRHAR